MTFSIGNLLKYTFQMIFKNAGRFILLPLIYFLAISFLFTESFTQASESGEVEIIGFLVVMILSLIGALLIYPIVMFGTVRTMRGQDWRFMEALGHVLRIIVPYFILGLLISFGIGLEMLLLLIPGIILFVRWYVALPVRVAEPVSITAAMSRSAALTSGRRWEIFGAALVLFVVGSLVAAIFGAVGSVIVFAFASGGSGEVGVAAIFLSTVVSVIGQTFSTLLFIVAPSVAYYLLRGEKEGGESEAIAEIFA